MAATPAPAHAQPISALAGQPGVAHPPRVEIIALTGDDALLEQIGQALDGESTFRHVESVAAAHEFIRPARPCVLLLDARGFADLSATVASVQAPDGTCIVVVLAPPEESANVARSLKGSATFAILSIPVEPGPTIAVLDGAREEALARFTLAAQRVVAAVAVAAPAASAVVPPSPSELEAVEPAPLAVAPAVARTLERHVDDASRARTAQPKVAEHTAGPSGGNQRKTMAAIVAVVALIAIVATYFALRDSPSDERVPARAAATANVTNRAATSPATDAAELQAVSSDELLDRARVAMSARHYTDPEGDNALAYFRAVLAQDPENEEATEGLQRIGVLLDGRLQSELAQRRVNDAAATLAQLNLIRPGDPALAPIGTQLAEAQIAAALDAGNVERAGQLLRQAAQQGTLPEASNARWRDEIGRRQGDVRAQPLANLVSTRIREGKLLDPATDSAKFYLVQLRKIGADPKGLANAATAELQQAVLQKIRETASQPRDERERWLAEASALGVSPTRIAAAMRAAPPAAVVPPVVSQTERLAQLVQDRINDGRLLEPSADSALAYLNALRATDPSSSAIPVSTRAVSDALLRTGRTALANRNVDQAQTNVAAARRLGINLGDVEALERAIAATRTAPAPASPPPSELKRTRYVPPEYPKDALKRGIGGEVRVRMTVDAEGKVKSATVVSSNPAEMFDRAALDAVRRWRFKPLAGGNPATEATLVTNIVFRPDDATKP